MSLVVFLATTVSTAPLEGKKILHLPLVLTDTLLNLWRYEVLLCFPEKEQEEVEVEATEEGELSEEEEGRPVCVCVWVLQHVT